MADKKISELTALTGADTATDDQLVIVDTSAGLTKSITVAEFQNALDGSTGFVRITGDTMTGALDVQSTITADGLTVDGAIAFNSTATFSDGSEARFGADNDMALFHSGGVNHIRVNSGIFKLRADDMRFTAQNGTSEFARFDSSGNFGIGEASPSTYGKLVVAGSTPFAVIRSTDTTTAGFSMLVNSGSNGVGSIGTDNGGHMTFDTGSTGAGQSERMRIKSTGEILHTLPSEDTTFAAGTDSTWNRLEIFQDRGAVNTASGIAFRSNSGTAPAGIVGVALNTTGGREELAFITSTGNASSEVMRLDENGNVGIGVTAPTGILSISGADTTSRPQLRFMTGEGTGLADAALSTTDDSGGTGLLIGSNLYYSGGSITRFSTSRSGSAIDFGYTGSMKFYTGSGNTAPDQKMTLDANGNLLVNKPSQDVISSGSELGLGWVAAARSGDAVAYFNRQTNDGDIAKFYKDGTTVGSIGVSGGDLTVSSSGSNPLRLQYNGNSVAKVESNSFNPANDNFQDLGQLSTRWDDIYATNGTIQTSDRNEKQDIAELSDAEQRVAVAAKGLLRKFRWKSAVAEKGDEARTHFGIIAQDLQAAFAAEGLDAGDYAMFISSTWTDEETGEERTRMGVRYSELLAFIIAAI